jgi:sugar phosphate permease
VLPQRVFYGWYIAVACGVLLMATIGVGYYGLAVFLGPLQDTHGWSNTVVSGATGLYFTVGGLTGALVGGHIDRHGPLRLQLVGVVLLAAGAASIGFVDQPWHLYLAYTVLAVGFGMSSSVAVNAIMARWFVARRGRAMSVANTGISIGGVLLVPLGTILVERGGLELASVTLSILVLGLTLPVILGVLAWTPADMGLEPDGGKPASPRARPVDASVQHRVWSRRQAARTGAFWAILGSFALVLMAQTGFVIHQISFLTDRFGSASAAAAALSITAFGSIVARLVVGIFADAVDKRFLTMGLFVTQGMAVIGIVAVDHRVVTYALVLVIGFTIGNVYMMQSLLIGEAFGMVSFGTILGLVGVASQSASGIGPFAIGWLEDTTGGYDVPFLVTAGVTIAAAALVWFARPPVPIDPGPSTSLP